jgi:protein TonB
MAIEDSDNLFTLNEVSQLTGLTTRELREHVNQGSLRVRQVGREEVLTQKDVLEFLVTIGIEPKWEKLHRPAQISRRGLFSWMARRQGPKIGGALGWSALIHGVLLTILGLVIGLGGRSEVSRFVAFNLETTTALRDQDNTSSKAAPTKRKEKVDKVTKKKPQPRKPTKTKVEALPVSELVEPEKELVPVVNQEIKANPIVADPELEKTGAEVGPFLISEKKPAEETELRSANEYSEEVDGPKKESNSDTSAGLKAAKPGPYRPGMGVTPPKLIYKVRPQYPKKAFDAGVEGAVELEIVVNADGLVGEVKVINLPQEGLDFEEAAVTAVQQWKFLPGRFQGKPVDVVAIVTVNFKMKE